jgi:hypothetical protein
MRLTTLVTALALSIRGVSAAANFSQSCIGNFTSLEKVEEYLLLRGGCIGKGLTWSLLDISPCIGLRNDTLKAVKRSANFIDIFLLTPTS